MKSHKLQSRVVFLAALTVCLPLSGCQWLRRWFSRPAQQGTEVQPIPTPAPYVPPAMARTLQTDTTTTTASQAGGDVRQQSPATLGDSARLLVGRNFDPIPFDAEATELSVEGRRLLVEYAIWFRAHPRIWAVLAGHTSPGGAERYNLNLGMARALEARKFLRDQGLDERRFFPIGYGDELTGAELDVAKTNRVEVLAFVAPEGVDLPPQIAGGPPVPESEAAQAEAPPPEDFP